ncbi:APC family permease [Leucothrix pacifica]|uniref:Amino acid permease n=1 Tax=Leucothrix pacifica TaxID=1247513 RepID=A0A317C9P9_9GAMM|nr:amino acid permease [Leucothrix pacifica]PWQ94891.1 amino acid permease [Leucothrix pacifica]
MTQSSQNTELRRSLSLPLVVLYGLGVTIGAGIYVLIGATAGKAGIYAPLSFVLAAFVMIFSAASMAELSARFPVSAGEAAYIRNGLRSPLLALGTGLLVVTSGLISAATVSIGSAGYIQSLIHLPDAVIIALVIICMGLIALWGITESVTFAAIFTFVEVAGLVAIVVAALWNEPEIVQEIPKVIPSFTDFEAFGAISAAGLLAFFAFIGFEDIVNLAEETKNPSKTIPWAIFLTLIGATLVYVAVVTIAVLTVPIDELSGSNAPVGLLFERITGASPLVITLIAIVATLNGVIIQMIMASRVLYGLGKQGCLPAMFAKVSRRTQTPVVSTMIVIVIILALALVFPINSLAEMTSRVALTVFTLINLSLIRIKLRGEKAEEGIFQVRLWVPVLGFITCVGFLASSFV